MKKILLYAVALFTAIGCQEAPCELGATAPADQLVSITIQAALSDDSDTRATVTPGEDGAVWKSSWESDDELTLLSASGTVSTVSNISIDSQTGVATFSGSVEAGTYEVYCLGNNYSIEDGALHVDYSAQDGSVFNKIPLKAANSITVTSDVEPSFDMLYFEHVAQTMELRVSLPVTGDEVYTLGSIDISGAKGDDADYYGFETVEVSMGDREVSSSTNSFKVYCYLPAFAVAAEESIVINANLKDDSGLQYIATTAVTNKTEAELAFEAGKHNYLTATFDEVNTLKWTDFAADTFAGGVAYDNATLNYTISTAEELALLAKLVNDGTSMHGKTFTLANDIDLSGREWTAIGFVDNVNMLYVPFKGTFDGVGFTVKGLYIDKPISYNQALFGYIDVATIKNLSVAGSIEGQLCVGVGGIVGYSVSSTVVNCYNRALLEGDGLYVGGIVGYSEYSTVVNCYNTASIEGSAVVGGVVGYSDSSTTVTNCYNTASVEARNDSVGGVVGLSQFSSKVTNCYWNSSIANVPTDGIGEDKAISSNIVEMSTEEMQEPAFVVTLTENAYYYNHPDKGDMPAVKAWAWRAVAGGTPEIDIDKIPTIKQLDDITTGVTVGE